MKTMDKLFTVSLSLISITSLITAVSGLIGFPLQPLALRIIGAVSLVSLPVLIYSTVKSMQEKLAAAKKLAGNTKAVPAKAESATQQPEPAAAEPAPPKRTGGKKATGGNGKQKSKNKRKRK